MELPDLLQAALERRAPLAARLAAEGTDTFRLFHGIAEGRPGLAIDRYGPAVLVQTFREPLADGELATIERVLRAAPSIAGADFALAVNHRGPNMFGEGGERAFRFDERSPEGAEHVVLERGVRFTFRARHRGRDPWLFLDLREARARFAKLCAEKSVLNLFAYTCTAGAVAAAAGAREVWNVDFAGSALDVGKRNLELNAIDPERVTFVHEDCLPVMRQLAGLPVKGRGSFREYARIQARKFDLAFLDPPSFAKGPFGAVDVVRDYPALLKPVLFALAPGGSVLMTNHAPEVRLDDWVATIERCAAKAGRPFTSVETFGPDADFPAFDGNAPLKVALARIATEAG